MTILSFTRKNNDLQNYKWWTHVRGARKNDEFRWSTYKLVRFPVAFVRMNVPLQYPLRCFLIFL